jgi:membrane fusion protein (multidrug efflux system)
MKTKLHLTAVIFSCFLFFNTCSNIDEQQTSVNDIGVSITVAQITTMDVSHFLTQTGTLFGNEEVLVKSEEKGKVKQICFKEGSKVKKNTVLVRLEDAKIRAEVKRLLAQIEQYKIQLARTEKTLKRNSDLLEEKVISDQKFDDLVAQKGIDLAVIEQAEASLLIAQKRLEDMEIRAPFDAVTAERLVAEGDYIAVGGPIVTVVQVDPLKVSIRIFEKFKKKIHIGMPVNISVEAFPEEVFTGSVYFISPNVDIKTRTFLVKALVPNPDTKLNPGMFANLSIEHENHKDATIVPWEAIVQLEDSTFVFTVINKKARRVPVDIIKLFNDMAEVKGKLEPGQDVIIDGKFTVEDGGKIFVQK